MRKSIRGFPFFILLITVQPWSTQAGPAFQAGLLTLGSFYSPPLPIPIHRNSGIIAVFVPDHSGGPVPDFNGVPFSAHGEHLKYTHANLANGEVYVKRKNGMNMSKA